MPSEPLWRLALLSISPVEKMFRILSFSLEYPIDAFNQVRVLGGNIMSFGYVCSQIVQLDGVPGSVAHGLEISYPC